MKDLLQFDGIGDSKKFVKIIHRSKAVFRNIKLSLFSTLKLAFIPDRSQTYLKERRKSIVEHTPTKLAYAQPVITWTVC